MQDEERAELLARALEKLGAHGDDHDNRDDAELAALIELGNEIEKQGPNLALLRRAEGEFDPAFARRLRGTLLAAHPGASPATPKIAETEHSGTSLQSRRPFGPFSTRTAAYRVMLLPFLLVAFIVTGVNALRHTTPVTQIATRAVVTATPARAIAAFSRKIETSSATPSPQSGNMSTSGAPPATAATIRPLLAPVAATPAAGGSTTPPGTARHSKIGSVPASTVPSLVVRLPAKQAALPVSAPVYQLRYRAFSAPAQAKIVASFPDLVGTGNGTYTAGGQSLQFVADQPGLVTYLRVPATKTTPPAAARLSSAGALTLAQDWLAVHQLIPSGVNLKTAYVAFDAGSRRVIIGPAKPAALASDQVPAGITMTFGSAGEVVAAQVRWPVLTAGTVQRLASVEAAVRAGLDGARVESAARAQPDATADSGALPVFTVTRVDLVYRAVNAEGHDYWQPYYRLHGSLRGASAATSATREVPAVSGSGAPARNK